MQKNRKEIRKELVEFKKIEEYPLGPYATFYFENFETMLRSNSRNAAHRKRW